jgi:hypothetical protein
MRSTSVRRGWATKAVVRATSEFQAVPPEAAVTFECTLDGKQTYRWRGAVGTWRVKKKKR